jgi:flavorubredoxin
LLPFSPVVANKMKKMTELNLPVKMIATDHGPIWRKNIEKIFNLYVEWSSMKPSLKAVIIYDTMWHSTEKMSGAIVEGLIEENIELKVMPLSTKHRSDIATEILDAGALIVGSPTINANIFPTVADVMTYLKGLKKKNLIGAAFGSYGWSGDAVKQLNQILEEMKVKIIHPGINVKYVPKEPELEQCTDLGRQIGKILKKES